MRLIVDTNTIISSLIKKSKSREIILSKNFQFYTIENALDDIEKYKALIIEKAGIKSDEFEMLLTLIFGNVSIIDKIDVEKQLAKARKIMDKIDPKDSPFLAATFATENEGIWSEDKHFERQKAAKVWKTKQLLKYL